MVIRDDDLHPKMIRCLDLSMSRGATIRGQHQPDALLAKSVKRRNAQSVALMDPVRDVHPHRSSETAQKGLQDAGCGNSVHVVVTVATNRLLLPNGLMHTINGLLHIRQQERIVPWHLWLRQPVPGLLRRVHPSCQ